MYQLLRGGHVFLSPNILSVATQPGMTLCTFGRRPASSDGAQPGAEICRLQDFGLWIEQQTVMSFFHDEIKYHHPNL